MLELTPLGGYRTTLDRSGLALAVGGVLGGLVATLLALRGGLLSPPGLALLFVGASVLTAAIITATAGPIWLICHLTKHRGPLTAALVGAVIGFALLLGGQTYGFGLYDMPVTDARTLTFRWLSGTATSLIAAIGAALIGVVMWRVAYRRDR